MQKLDKYASTLYLFQNRHHLNPSQLAVLSGAFPHMSQSRTEACQFDDKGCLEMFPFQATFLVGHPLSKTKYRMIRSL